MIKKSWLLLVCFIYLVISMLNSRELSDPDLLLHLHPDQVVVNGYIKKSIDSNSFINDYVFVNNSNIVNVYNPIEIFLYKRLFYAVNFNINLFYKILFQAYFLIYITIFSFLFYKISNKNIKGLIILLFACSSIYLGFSADVFGFNSLQNIRSAYFILPFLAISLYLLLFNYNYLISINKYSTIFFVSNIILNYHPVTQIHFILISVLYLISLLISKRTKISDFIFVLICLLITTLPLIYTLSGSVFSQKGHFINDFSLNDFKNVMPAYKVHIPYYAIENKFRLNTLIITSFIFCLTYILYFYYFYLKNINRSINKYFYKALMFFSSLMFLLVFNRGQGYVLLISLLLILLYLNIKQEEYMSSLSIDRLFLFSSSIMISIVGGILLNLFNEFRGSNLLNLELIRGIRISYIILLFWLVECISKEKNNLISFTSMFLLYFPIWQLYTKYSNSKSYESAHYSDFRKLNSILEIYKRKDKNSIFLYIVNSYDNSIVEANLLKNISSSNTYYSYDGMNCIYSNKNSISIFSKRINDYHKIFDSPEYINNVTSKTNIDLIFIAKDAPLKINPAKYSLYRETFFFKIYTKI